ncbi:hypothetical protein LINPERHAP2_LOCUS41774 [Linum perenne]
MKPNHHHQHAPTPPTTFSLSKAFTSVTPSTTTSPPVSGSNVASPSSTSSATASAAPSGSGSVRLETERRLVIRLQSVCCTVGWFAAESPDLDLDLAELSPVSSVGGEGDVAHIVTDDGSGKQRGPLGENDVVSLHDLSGGFCGGNEHVGDFAELESHNSAVSLGKITEAVVGERSAGELVEVSGYRELSRTWRRQSCVC